MELQQYLEKLKDRFEAYYNVELDFNYEGYNYDFHAVFFQRDEKYIATKKTVIYEYEQFEHILLKYFKDPTIEDLKDFVANLENATSKLVVPTNEHMSTLVRGVFLVDGAISDELIEFVKKYSYYKSFCFGFKGWVNIALNMVDINNMDKHYHNKRGKGVKKHFAVEL